MPAIISIFCHAGDDTGRRGSCGSGNVGDTSLINVDVGGRPASGGESVSMEEDICDTLLLHRRTTADLLRQTEARLRRTTCVSVSVLLVSAAVCVLVAVLGLLGGRAADLQVGNPGPIRSIDTSFIQVKSDTEVDVRQ